MFLKARERREMVTDWQTARVVAMIARVNFKREKYEPAKWMMDGKRIKREAAQARTERAKAEPMSGAEIVARFREMGVQIIDRRADKTATIH